MVWGTGRVSGGSEGRVVGLRVGLGMDGQVGGYMGMGRVEGQGFGVDGVMALSIDRAELGTGGLR